jgi:Fuc2NAc and GlcNAc transferase
MIYISLIILFLLSASLTYYYIQYAWRHKLIDIPNARSSHTHLTPRGGGLVFISLWAITTLIAFFCHFLNAQETLILLPGTLLVGAIGFLDDRYNLPVYMRALIYLLAAIMGVLVLGGFPQLILSAQYILPLGLLGTVIAVLVIFWSINLFNFMDGLDGIAATEALFILSVGGFFLAQSGGYQIAISIWWLAACIGGFLVWNKPPAKVFMGDAGSTALGFIITMLALWGEKQYGVPILLWFILYGIFWMDTTITVIRRLIAKESIYQAHRTHAYQRLNRAGFSHTKILMMMSGINLILAILAIFAFYYRNHLLTFVLIALGILAIFYGIAEKIKPMRNSAL